MKIILLYTLFHLILFSAFSQNEFTQIKPVGIELKIPVIPKTDFRIFQKGSRIFHKSINLRESVIPKFVTFRFSTFQKDADFTSSRFLGNNDLLITTFKDDVSFDDAIFDSVFECEDGNFEKNISFNGAIFKNILDITHASFSRSISFNKSQFYDNAIFRSIEFTPNVDFSETTISKELFFDKCIFDSTVNFSNIKFKKGAKIVFSKTVLPLHLNFSLNSMIDGEVDFYTGCTFDPNQLVYINLYRTDVSKIKLNYTNFRIELKDNLGKKLNEDEAKSLYEGLLKNFKDNGQLESYKILDLEYRYYKDDSYYKWKSFIEKYWWNFGYDKDLVFKNSFFALLLFSLITTFFLPFLNNEVYSINGVSTIVINSKSSLADYFKRIWYSIIYTSCIFFLFSLKVENFKFKKLATLYIVFVYCLGIICLAYMANFVLQK